MPLIVVNRVVQTNDSLLYSSFFYIYEINLNRLLMNNLRAFILINTKKKA